MSYVDASDYAQFAAKLKDADRQIATAVRKELREVAKPIAQEVVREGSVSLPHRGGLSANVESARTTINVLASGVALSLGGRAHRKGEGQLRQIDENGQIRHPVYANRKVWAVTKTEPHRFTESFLAHKDQAVAALSGEITRILKETLT